LRVLAAADTYSFIITLSQMALARFTIDFSERYLSNIFAESPLKKKRGFCRKSLIVFKSIVVRTNDYKMFWDLYTIFVTFLRKDERFIFLTMISRISRWFGVWYVENL